MPAVLADDRAGVRTAVDYLTGLGHRRIAYLGGPGQELRLSVFREARGRPRGRGARRASRGAAATPPTPPRRAASSSRPDLTAVLAGGNLLGEAAVLAARELDLRVPRDLSLVMFDDVPWAELCSPPLTVIAQPAQDIGYRAAELVLREGGRRPRSVLLPTELIVRGSCGPGERRTRTAETPVADARRAARRRSRDRCVARRTRSPC